MVKFKKIGIIANYSKNSRDRIIAYFNEISKILSSYSIELFLSPKTSDILENTKYKVITQTRLKSLDLLISLGGDGTLLYASHVALKHEIKILAINSGTLGFMVEHSPDKMDKIFEKLFNDEFIIEERSLINAVVKHNGKKKKDFYALNEISLTRDNYARLIHMDVFVNSIKIEEYRGDGLLISTSTGSTAYSLSAGGPIVSPKINCFIINPICPHTIHARPILIPVEDKIKIKFSEDSNTLITVDGRSGCRITEEDTIYIKESKHKVKLISFNKNNFYKVLKTKKF